MTPLRAGIAMNISVLLLHALRKLVRIFAPSPFPGFMKTCSMACTSAPWCRRSHSLGRGSGRRRSI